jgi:predicted Zn-dependent protease
MNCTYICVQFKANASGNASRAGRAMRRSGDEELVKQIGTKLLQAMVKQAPKNGTYMGHIKPEKWEFVVLDDPEVNACALPGGKVIVNTGAKTAASCLICA